jgi:hypothetical protein
MFSKVCVEDGTGFTNAGYEKATRNASAKTVSISLQILMILGFI